MSKQHQVNEFVTATGHISWLVKDDDDAEELVDDVTNNDFDTSEEWQEAFEAFMDKFVAYADRVDEQTDEAS